MPRHTTPHPCVAYKYRAPGPHPIAPNGGVYIPVPESEPTVVSPCDYAVAMSRRWRNRNGYIVANAWDARTKRSVLLQLHRVVTRAPRGVLVDHRWHNPLDNRREALRRATPSQNAANARKRKRRNPYRGVTLHKATGRWQSGAKKDDRFHHAGLFDDPVEAARAYDRLARMLWGQFALLNFPAERERAA